MKRSRLWVWRAIERRSEGGGEQPNTDLCVLSMCVIGVLTVTIYGEFLGKFTIVVDSNFKNPKKQRMRFNRNSSLQINYTKCRDHLLRTKIFPPHR